MSRIEAGNTNPTIYILDLSEFIRNSEEYHYSLEFLFLLEDKKFKNSMEYLIVKAFDDILNSGNSDYLRIKYENLFVFIVLFNSLKANKYESKHDYLFAVNQIEKKLKKIINFNILIFLETFIMQNGTFNENQFLVYNQYIPNIVSFKESNKLLDNAKLDIEKYNELKEFINRLQNPKDKDLIGMIVVMEFKNVKLFDRFQHNI